MVVTCGERAICHTVDPELLAGELARAVELYLGSLRHTSGPMWRSGSGFLPLDPGLPLGSQIPPDAEIDYPIAL